jgi:hypothetical protein
MVETEIKKTIDLKAWELKEKEIKSYREKLRKIVFEVFTQAKAASHDNS